MEEVKMNHQEEAKMVRRWDVSKRRVKQRNKKICWLIAIVLLSVFAVAPASAFQVYRGEDLKITWDNTFKYSASFRVQDQSAKLIADPLTDDGDRNFDTGLTSNRFDLTSEFDAIYKNIGVRISAAAWYDTVYNEDNDNDSPSTANSFSVPHDEFTEGTEDLHGKDFEFLDAFVFGKGRLGKMPVSMRLGAHTLLWGESLFLGTNGISYGQAPMDVVRLLGVPGTLAKELFRPVEQASILLQPFSNLSVAGFYQWQWEASRLPGAGSYFSDIDILDEGGERLLPPGAPPGAAFFRGRDLDGDDSGQWGVAVKYRPDQIDWEFGLYYYTYHDRAPQIYLRPGMVVTPGGAMILDPSVVDMSIGKIGEYFLVYPEEIEILGASFTTQFGDVSLAGEVHMRFDTPLQSAPQAIMPGMAADNDDNALYAVGDSFHANLSVIYLLKPKKFWQGGQFLGEIGYNGYTDVDKNKQALFPGKNRDVWGFRFMFEPAYFQVLPGVDIKVPIGFAYNPKGNSYVDGKFNGGADEGGDFSIGLAVDYLQEWKCAVTYTSYYGDTDTQTIEDRDFISFWVRRTF